MRTEIVINSIEKESEKALLINVTVNWNEGNWHQRSFWMPKSAIELIKVKGEQHAMVEDWLLQKLRENNAFNGYPMAFPLCFNSHFAG